MKQYGVKASWTQLCSIRMNGYCMKPLAFTKKGEIIIAVDNEELYINDVEDDSFKSLLRFEEQLKDLRIMATYANSSTSLGCDFQRNRGNIPPLSIVKIIRSHKLD
ncbi:hypothetical protein NC652_012628 [Populus alba x Populus x berolinensis]|nr:hypothetical protein NC652_012628 [Populus alba x Populus x berolinensis]